VKELTLQQEKKLAESIRNNDLSVVQDDAWNQTEKGAHLLDINLGMPDIDQKIMMKEVVNLIQQSIDTPLVIDSTAPQVIEEALKYYQGKALINSVNGEEESMEKILPLAKRYGAGIIALALDENGIPEGKEGRLKVLEKIVAKAAEYGLSKESIFADCLVLTMGTSDFAAKETLETIKLVKEKLGLSVVLGVSNVSHGLPERSKINAAFLSVAIYNGLDLGIVNPENIEIMDAWEAASLIAGRDPHAGHYLERNTIKPKKEEKEIKSEEVSFDTIKDMVVKGSKNILLPVAALLEQKKISCRNNQQWSNPWTKCCRRKI
jgi:5-methyltetrahydrofolate--homocysteine methyltransferase